VTVLNLPGRAIFHSLFPPLRFVAALILLFVCNSYATSSPQLAKPIEKNCLSGAKYAGTPGGKNFTIAGVPKHLATPRRPSKDKRVILFFSDVFRPFYENSFIVQVHFASNDVSHVTPAPSSIGSGIVVLDRIGYHHSCSWNQLPSRRPPRQP
jgi:hypothetical protein